MLLQYLVILGRPCRTTEIAKKQGYYNKLFHGDTQTHYFCQGDILKSDAAQ